MEAVRYPFDSMLLLTQKKRIKRQLLEQLDSGADLTQNIISKKIAILGGSTSGEAKELIELFLLGHGIKAQIYEGAFGSFYEELAFSNDALKNFAPDIIYIYTTHKNIREFPSVSDSKEIAIQKLENEFQRFESIWQNAFEHYNCPIIQNNFDPAPFRLLGNNDCADFRGAQHFLFSLNAKFYEFAQKNPNFHICDINFLAADMGLKNWHDFGAWHSYKYAISPGAMALVAFNVSNIIKAIFGRNKKAFVLDLDNTLWGGVIGDEGANIKIGTGDAESEAFLEFQKYIKAHKELGVALSICSKNDEANALLGLKHKESALAPSDFATIKANWERKDENIRAIATELNLGIDSFVFVDDNPAERELVRKNLGVEAPEISCITDYITTLDRSGFFEVVGISKDDLNRAKSYEQNAKRNALQSEFSDYKDFLRSLKMSATICPFKRENLPRITQLINKSNQFNLTTKRMNPNEVEALLSEPNAITLEGSLSDKFGDNGLVAVVFGHLDSQKIFHIEAWLMSCRVLKRDLEFAMMDELVRHALNLGAQKLRGYFIESPKNSMVKDFYKNMGFEMVSALENGSVWNLEIKNYKNKNSVIEVHE